MNKRLLIAAGVLALVAVATVVGYFNYKSGDAVQYKTARIERGNLQSTVSASGTVNPVTQVSVGTQVSGQLKELLVDFNSVVKAGQLIAQIDPETFEYRVRSAQADVDAARAQVLTAQANISASKVQVSRAQLDLDEARRDLARKESLVAQQFIAQSEGDKARAVASVAGESLKGAQAQLAVTEAQIKSVQANVNQREAILAQARIDLERTKIRSPVNGIVIKRAVEKGQTVAASLQSPELFVIAQNLSDMQVDASIDESDIGRVKAGQKATFTVDAFAGQIFEGEVRQVRNAAQTVANVVTYTAVIGFSNAGGRLLPGMTANVRVITDTREGVLKVPNAALRMRIAGVEPAPAGAASAPPSGAVGQLGSNPLLRSADWVVSALVGTAYAQGAGAGLRDRLVEQLGLNESQQAKLDAILTEYRPKLMALREMPEDQRALERDKVMVPMRAAINNILNKDQKAKYADLVAQQQGRGGQTGAPVARAASAATGATSAKAAASLPTANANNAVASNVPGATAGGQGGAPGAGATAGPGGQGGPGGQLAAFRAKLASDLALTASQLDGVDSILAQVRPKFATLREVPEAERPKARERILGEMRAQIGDLLTPAQKPRYQALLVELANRQQSRGRVYLLGADGKPRAVNVRLGISDGTFTELLVGQGSSEVTEGSQVIVGLAQAGGGSASGGGASSGSSGGSQRPSGPRLPF